MTWAWFLLGWLGVALVVGPLLGRGMDDPEFDDDWP